MTEPSQAVFISYAAQDAQAAKRICDALRGGGIEVWFDQSELRGGDAWDQAIRKQIKACALFIPVISTNAHARVEGYFRLEWKLAVDRSYLIAPDRPFLLPVVIDETHATDERIPDRFRELQWTRLPDGQTPTAFAERVRRLLLPAASATTGSPAGTQSGSTGIFRTSTQAVWSSTNRGLLVAAGLVVLGALAYLAIEKLWIAKPQLSSPTAAAGTAPTAFTPPPHSIAVLPFINLSGDQEQEYFSDGLTEELLNSLAEINGLQVAARTSAFSFKGKDHDIGTIGRKLNVATVLEGSVRRSANTVRITAQLINSVTGFHLWSRTYDRDLGNVLQLQTEIATAVASALKVTLLGDEASKIELGGTRNPVAFDTYLRASKSYYSIHGAEHMKATIAMFSEAIRLDPDYALALAARSVNLSGYAQEFAVEEADRKESFDRALSDARRAVAIAPGLAEAHDAQALFYRASGDYPRAMTEYLRAAELAPGNAQVLREYGRFVGYMGRADAGIAATRRAAVLDPLNPRSHYRLAEGLYIARRYEEAVAAYEQFINLDPESPHAHAFQGIAHYGLGNYPAARAACETKSGQWNQLCLALVYEKLGRHTDAEAQLAKIKASDADAGAYQYAEIYAQWGKTGKALDWLETALRLRDPGLVELKTDPLMDPLRREPRFQAVMREMKFPD